MTRISSAKSRPKPSRRKDAFKPSAGIQGQLCTSVSPSRTIPACDSTMASATATMAAVVRAGSIPSVRLSTAGSQAPASGIRMASGQQHASVR